MCWNRSRRRWRDSLPRRRDTPPVRAELVEAIKGQMMDAGLPQFLIQSMGGKLPEWIAAIAAFISMCGVLLLWKPLRLTKNIAQLQFEDAIKKEYRELVSSIPTKALLDSDLTEEEYGKSFDEFFRYFDLSNRQVALRKENRIGQATGANWVSGIRFNLSLPAFSKAWGEIKSRTEENAGEFLSELRSLEGSNFADPKCLIKT